MSGLRLLCGFKNNIVRCLRIYGRPRQQQTLRTTLSLRRPLKWVTIRGVKLDNKDKLQERVQPQNYLKEMDTVFRNRIKRKANTLDEFPRGKIQKQLFKSKLTGRLDADIQPNAGSVARCGVKDTDVSERESGWSHFAKKLPATIRRRFRRYIVQGSKWPDHKTTLKWTVHPSKWGTKMTASEVKSTLTKAFRTWAEVSPLVFRWEPIPSQADITIEFLKGYHGCKQSFDGPKGILAHAYYPKFSGDIHFDDDEAWKPETSDSKYKSFLKVAIHEIGHSLGLKHSTVAGAMMGPFYITSLSIRLSTDDIKGIQSVYGRCEPDRISSIEGSFASGKTYIFKDSLYWKYDDLNNQVEWPGYPRDVAKGWNGIPSKIDEMFLWRYFSRVYFFVGKYYYLYDEFKDKVQSSSYPKLISQGWSGVPDNIDAAFAPDYDYDYSYFFKGVFCYIYNNQDDKVEKVERISVKWPGVPDNLDTVFVWPYNGFTYFFKGKYYYEWDNVKGHAKGPYRIKDGWNNICEV